MPENTLPGVAGTGSASAMPKMPPHSDAAEQAVLGAMMIDPQAVSLAVEKLKPDDFYNHRHAMFFEAMADLSREHSNVDLVTIQARLAQNGSLSDASDISYLSDIATAVPTSANVKDYIKIVQEQSFYRKLLNFGNQIQSDIAGADQSPDALSAQLEKKLYDILSGAGGEDFKSIQDLLNESLADMHAAADNGGPVAGIPTGFADLDAKTLGFMPSDLIILGARPSMGKSALALGIALNMAVKSKKTCAVFSLEMSGKQVVNRFISALSGVSLQNIRKGDLANDWKKIAQVMVELSQAPIYIDDTGGITVAQMRSKCMRLKLQHGLDFIMVDYMQLMSGSGRNTDSRQNEVAEISRSLKALARELNVPVLALSQLSRATETRAEHRPQLSDLRDSGQIEQDADLVFFLHRPWYYNHDLSEGDVAEVNIAKQRNGPVGMLKLLYDADCTRFLNLERSDPRLQEE